MKDLLKKGIAGLALLLLLPLPVLAQDGSVSGTVTDAATGEPLPGTNVLIEELGQGAATGVDGNYTISDIPAGDYTLVASFVGYEEAEVGISVAPGEEVTQDVALEPDFTGLEEVVVTGLASRTSRAQAAIDVTSIDAEELTEQNVYAGVADLLTGKIAGVSISQSSGNVGSGFRFEVRSGGGIGGGQPVVYIDGIRVENEEVEGFATGGQGVSTLANLNPENIADVEILKGPAAAALYGASGANGVVLITTKTGSGITEPLSVRYKFTTGVNQQIEEYTLENSPTPDVANAFARNGAIQQHSLSVAGGGGVVNYYGNISYDDTEGTLPGNQLERLSYRANFEVLPTDNLIFSANAFYSTATVERPQNDNNIYGIIGNTTLSPSPFNFSDSTAIVSIDNVQRNNQFLGAVDLTYTPFAGFELNAGAGYEITDIRNDETVPADVVLATIPRGARNIFERRNEQFTYDLNARYSYSISEDLEATTSAGMQAFDRTLREFFLVKQDYPSALITNIGAGSQFISGDEDFIDTRQLGVFIFQDLSYRDLLFVNLGLRRDYASVIGVAAPSIYYPQARLALRLDQFDFVPDYFDLLKPRIAYGESGQLPGLLDGTNLLWEAQPSAYGAGAVLNFIGNPGIEPERVREVVVGLDGGLFDRLTFGLTYYRQRATGSIVDLERAPSTGQIASAVPFNIGEKKGQGVEVTAGVTAFRTERNALTLDATYSYRTNEILDLGGAQPIFFAFDNAVIQEGLPEFAWYTYRSEAEFNEAGELVDIVPAEVDEEGNPERELLGVPVPNHTGSFSLNFRFLDDFNLYALVDYEAGLSVLNGSRSFRVIYGGDMERNVAGYRIGVGPYAGLTDEELRDANVGYLTDYEAGGLEPGTGAYREAAQTYASLAVQAGGVATDGNFVEDADFVKLREVSLSYDLSDLINRLGGVGGDYVDRASLVLSARNVLTFTGYSGIDPEVNYAGARGLTQGYDFLTLAPPRTITATLLLRF